MKSLKYFILAFFSFGLMNNILSQIIVYENEPNFKTTDDISQPVDKKISLNRDSKISYNVEVGSMYSTSKYFGNNLLFYTSPEIRYRLSPKLNITAGFILINSNYSPNKSGDKQNRTVNKAYFKTGFDYTMERLRVSGEILYGPNNFGYSFGTKKNSVEYFARFNAEYKITEHFSIGLQIVNQNMNNGYYWNPYSNQVYNPYNFYGY